MANMDWRLRSDQIYYLSSEKQLWLQDYKLEYTYTVKGYGKKGNDFEHLECSNTLGVNTDKTSHRLSSGYYTLSFPESKNAIRFYVPHEYSEDFPDLPNLEKMEYLESNGDWIDVSQDDDFAHILWPFVTSEMIRI